MKACRRLFFWFGAFVIGTSCTREQGTVDCIDYCVSLDACGLLPSALGEDPDDCKTRCENSNASKSETASNNFETVKKCFEESGASSGAEHIAWCDHDEGVSSCMAFHACLLNSFENPEVVGESEVTVSVTVIDEELSALGLGGANNCPSPPPSNTDPAHMAEEVCADLVTIIPIPVADERPAMPVSCEASLGLRTEPASVLAGIHEPKVKVLGGKMTSQLSCRIVSGGVQLAQAGRSNRLRVYVPKNPFASRSSFITDTCESAHADGCFDGVDNDGDGQIDCLDVTCSQECKDGESTDDLMTGDTANENTGGASAEDLGEK